jgi:hypothetical protein
MSVYRVGTNKSSTNVFPSIRPTLDLDFANTKTLDPRITFTRASGGSYVGADGLIKYAGVNEARFDHDPETGESLGLLIEEARTNNAVSSQDFTTLWFPNGSASVISNAILSPSGNLDGTKFVEPTVNQENYIRNAARTLSAGTYTASIYVHESSERRLSLRPVHLGSTHHTSSVIFNPKTKTLGSPIGFGISASATNAGGGWWRVSLTFTTPDTRNIQHGVNAITASAVYTGDGTSGIYIWGAQLEAGAFPTSYIPTQASTRTRALDSAQITGKNFSDFYRQDEGSMVLFGMKHNMALGSFKMPYDLSDGSVPNEIHVALRVGDYTVYSAILNNGIVRRTDSISGNVLKPFLAGDPFSSSATSWKPGELVTSFRGDLAIIRLDINIPYVSRLDIGRRVNNTLIYIGTISRLTYFPKRLSNEQLRALTR